jgi:hypothetical protein
MARSGFATPILITFTAFRHYNVIMGHHLSPAIAFTSVGLVLSAFKLYFSSDEWYNHVSLNVFHKLKFALSAPPETFINMLHVRLRIPCSIDSSQPSSLLRQGLVLLRRSEPYLSGAEVRSAQPVGWDETWDIRIVLSNATISWPRDRRGL